jgi:lysophospholipase L1-like esterase
MMSDKKTKVIFVFLGFFLALAALELTLRFLGFGYYLVNRPGGAGAADYRIFCVGESTTWGIGAKDQRTQNYPKQLEGMLQQRYPEKKIRCFFDRTIGQNTSEILMKFPDYLMTYHPDLVILMVGVNNWWNMDRGNFLLFTRNSRIARLTLKTLAFLDRFRVWKLLKWIRFSLGGYGQRWNYWFPPGESEKALMRNMLDYYGLQIQGVFNALAATDIAEMVKICQANNIRVVLSSYPFSDEGLYLIHCGLAKKFSLPFVDNRASFKKLDNREEYLWKDGWHPNEKGYTLVAKNIYSCIVDNKFIDR